MARGRDSSRDPRRQLPRFPVAPDVAAAALSQAALRRYLTGQASADPVGDVGRVPADKQPTEIYLARERNLSELRSIMRPEDHTGHHKQRGEAFIPVRKGDSDWREGTKYGMTRGEYMMRDEGMQRPRTGWGSENPSGYGFNFGKDAAGASASEAADAAETVVDVKRKSDNDK